MTEKNIAELSAAREKAIVKTSVIGILTNVFLVGFKAAVGLLSNSIAISSEQNCLIKSIRLATEGSSILVQ